MSVKQFNHFSLKHIHRWDLILVIIAVSVSLAISIFMGSKTYDDAYITFRYAKNITQGAGFVYNPGEHFLGTTTPLFTLLLALISVLLSIDLIPMIGQWLTGVSLCSLAIFTYLLGRNNGKLVAGFISALFVLINPLFIQVWGGEILFFLGFVVAGIFFYYQEYTRLSAIIFGLAFLTRGEGILPGLVLLAHAVLVRRKIPWGSIIAFVGTITPWLLYSFFTFGSFFPSTLQAKIAQMASGLWPPFLITSLDMFRAYLTGSPNFPHVSPQYTYFIILVLVGLGGISLLLDPQYVWWSIFVWLGLYVLGYTVINVPFYHWYAMPLLYGGIILIGLGTQQCYDFLYKRLYGHKFYTATLASLIIILGLPLFVSLKLMVRDIQRPVAPVQNFYTNTGLWLAENTPTTATVGYFEIGFLGYHANRTMIDPAGLVNPGTAAQVARRNFKWAYLHYKPDYLIINKVRWYDRLGNIREEAWFPKAYQKVGIINEAEYFDSPIMIYKKINENAIPAP